LLDVKVSIKFTVWLIAISVTSYIPLSSIMRRIPMSEKNKKSLRQIVLAILVFLLLVVVVRIYQPSLEMQSILSAVPYLIEGSPVLINAVVKYSKVKDFAKHLLFA